MLSAKAKILGLLCSDGNYRCYISQWKEFDKRRGNSYNRKQIKRIIEFSNIDIALLKTFQQLLHDVYENKPSITISNHDVFRVCITKNSIIDDILQNVTLGTSKWFVPDFVLYGNKKVKSAFLQGFFDGDGSVDFILGKVPRVRISSANLFGLKQVSILLEDLKIAHNLNGPYKRQNRLDEYQILLKQCSIISFINRVGSSHSKKKERFRKIIDAEVAQPGTAQTVEKRA